jgi:DNA-binding NtrC family response regulator
LDLRDNIAGVVAAVDYVGQLETALKTLPQTRHVVIVNGTSKVGLFLAKQFRKAFEPYTNRLNFIYLGGLPLGEITEKVKKLPENSIVLFYLMLLDAAGESHIPVKILPNLTKAANAPVFGAFDTYFGKGIVGGRLLSYEMLGVKAGEIGLQILRGARPSDIPISSHGTHLNLFDWRELKRWDISEDRLPPGSIVRFKTPSFWEIYRWYLMRVTQFSGQKGGVIISHADITERKLAEIGLRDAYTEIEQLKNKLEAETAYLQEEIKLEHDFESIIGNSPAIQHVLFKVEQVADTDTTVLVLGETGTGKELVARAIHNRSSRQKHPLVKVNCTAMPANLIESELFGHEAGAFTGAQTRQIGRFEVADGTSIFLDEIGELPLGLQTKMLQVLQDGEFERLGSSRTIKVNVRVIAATNRDLEAEVHRGRFRQDLFYRLNVFPITVPPLRERIEDISLLAEFFMEKVSKRLGKSIELMPASVMNTLRNYPWPGNVRELQNVIERAVISSSGPKLQLTEELKPPQKALSTSLKTMEAVEYDHILQVLEHTDWKVSGKDGASEILGLKRGTLRARMQKLGIRKP